jgi:hypothetical protein
VADVIDRLVALVVQQRDHGLPGLFFEPEPILLAEVEEAIPEIARAVERHANGIPINGANRT